MRLTRFGYEELVNSPGEWRLEPFALQQTNLIVGRNSVGKTRTLNVISGLARFILGGDASADGKFVADFEHQGAHWSYDLKIAGAVVIDERLSIDGKIMIDQSKGEIWSDDSEGVQRFKLPSNQLAVKGKFDLLQTPYLAPLHEWANAVFHFHFNSPLGQNMLTLIMPGAPAPDINFKDEQQTTQIYRHANLTYGEEFDAAILTDMRSIGYSVSEIGLGGVVSLQTNPQLGHLQGLVLRESGVGQYVDQHAMSTGMYRALAIIIHVNYGIFSKQPELILLDDIGEGLDFERSKSLITLLTNKVQRSNIQIIMTSNDRFIMNAVDLDLWTVLSRSGTSVRAFNKRSNPQAFEDFKYTGLQNFDFFSMDLATEIH